MEAKTLKPLFLQAPVEDRGQKRSALADEGDVSRQGQSGREGSVEPVQRIHDAEAIGPHNPHLAEGFHHDLPFQRRPGLATSLKPAEMMMQPLTPAWTHSRTRAGTSGRA